MRLSEATRKGKEMTTKSRVLFICTANAARSQMAEGLLRTKFGDRLRCFFCRHPANKGKHPGDNGDAGDWD